jgi:hypothetical protein
LQSDGIVLLPFVTQYLLGMRGNDIKGRVNTLTFSRDVTAITGKGKRGDRRHNQKSNARSWRPEASGSFRPPTSDF